MFQTTNQMIRSVIHSNESHDSPQPLEGSPAAPTSAVAKAPEAVGSRKPATEKPIVGTQTHQKPSKSHEK